MSETWDCTFNLSLTDREMLKRITESCNKHPRTKLIEENLSVRLIPFCHYGFVNASVIDVNKIARIINPNKVTITNNVPLSRNVIGTPLQTPRVFHVETKT